MIEIKKVFLDDLPHGGEKNISESKINWIKSIGYKVKFTYDDITGWIEIIDYNSKTKKLKIKYNNIEYEVNKSIFYKCQFAKILGKIMPDFRLQIHQHIITDTKDITILDRIIKTTIDKKGMKRNYKYYKIICNKCNNIKWIEECHLISRKQFSSCCIKTHKAKLGVNTIWDTDKWMIPIVGEDVSKTHTHCSPERIYAICPDCGRKSNKTINIYNIYNHKGVFCSCNDGIKYPNKFCFCMLEYLNIDFINEYSPDWIGRKAYDFFFELNDKKYIIEMDGGMGHGKRDNTINGQTKEESKEIDNYKDKMAKLHNIEVIRIDCDYSDITKRFEKIKQNILNSRLNELFDLSKIDWLKIEEFSLSNLVKRACELKRNNPDLTTGQIAKIMDGIHTKGTIRLWLIKGNELGWCIYDAEKERHMSGKISASAKFKPTICLNNGMVFRSAKECSENSLELLGIHIDTTCIGEVCRGKRKQTKGFSFKHIKNLTQEEYIKYDIENKLKELREVC